MDRKNIGEFRFYISFMYWLDCKFETKGGEEKRKDSTKSVKLCFSSFLIYIDWKILEESKFGISLYELIKC